MSKVYNKNCIVTGGGGGIGRSLCEQLAIAGARGIYVVDINRQSASGVANILPSLATNPNFRAGHSVADVGKEEDVKRVISSAWEMFGSVEVFFSNAGIFNVGGIDEKEVSNQVWDNILDVNVMSIVFAARHIFPMWKRDKIRGIFCITASAAGLLMQLGCLPYHVTKHAALSVADWLAVAHHKDGVSIHCLCPQGVNTNMLTSSVTAITGNIDISGGNAGIILGEILSPKDVAIAALDGIDKKQFLILTHPEVKEYFQIKASDYGRWIKGMRKVQQRVDTMVRPNLQSRL